MSEKTEETYEILSSRKMGKGVVKILNCLEDDSLYTEDVIKDSVGMESRDFEKSMKACTKFSLIAKTNYEAGSTFGFAYTITKLGKSYLKMYEKDMEKKLI